MILTEDKTYTMSLETEGGSDDVLTNKTVELEFSNRELIHAVITCGMPVQRLTAVYPEKRRLEVLYKLFLVETALEAEGDRLKKAKKTAYLDSSEKSVISYYMGMFFTKMISGRLYGTDYLTQMNLIRRPEKEDFIDFFASEWRPEMIGHRSGAEKWSVWETKGGSNRREQALKKGAQQLEAIGTVNGAEPESGIVCMTYYDHGYLCGILREPQGDTAGEQIVFAQEEFYRAYYKPVCELFLDKESGLRFNGSNAEIAVTVPYFSEKHEEPEERKIRIGTSRKLLQALMEENYSLASELAKEQKQEECPDGVYLGADGIYIR